MRGYWTRAVRRLAEEESGFTLIELLNVILILAILMLTAIPTYLSARDRAYKGTATANTRTIIASARLYATDNAAHSLNDPDAATSVLDAGYAGMTVTLLKASYNQNIASTSYINNSGTEASGVTVRAPLDAAHYCVYSQQGRWFAYQLNPNSAIMVTSSAAAVCT